MRALLEGYLGERGFGTTQAADGNAVLRSLARRARLPDDDPDGLDVIIADVDLPGRSGIDILIAVNAAGWKVPVVLISAEVSRGLRAALLDMGAAAVLTKPLSMTVLERVLERAREAGRGG